MENARPSRQINFFGCWTARRVLLLCKILLQRILIIVLSFTILMYCSVLINWINQPIAHVEICSTFTLFDKEDIEKKLAPWLVHRFLYLNLNKMRAGILTIPWVKEASFHKQWPNKLIVRLEERKPIVRWQKDALMDVDGKIFRPAELKSFDELPLLFGPEDKSYDVMQEYLTISQVLRPLDISVQELRLSTTDAWWFKVDHVAVNIGRDRKMERLQRFVRLYYAKLNNRWQEVKRVDLRYLNGASVAWK